MAPTLASAQDMEAGKAIFRRCAVCHAADAQTNKLGPHLGGVIGRQAGSVEGFAYSPAMKDAGAAGLRWDEAPLAEFLNAPKVKVPGTKMTFPGLKSDSDVSNVIAYLKSLASQ